MLVVADGGSTSLVWHEADRQLFVKQFGHLGIMTQYLAVRTQLVSLGEQGAAALGRVERELLLKVSPRATSTGLRGGVWRRAGCSRCLVIFAGP